VKKTRPAIIPGNAPMDSPSFNPLIEEKLFEIKNDDQISNQLKRKKHSDSVITRNCSGLHIKSKSDEFSVNVKDLAR